VELRKKGDRDRIFLHTKNKEGRGTEMLIKGTKKEKKYKKCRKKAVRRREHGRF